ncbi:6-pyruvoyl trahydropterin synthase family protein [Ramlibacter alkalitolerans]|uniref:6-carboxy-5,6,7,8-tetrahydropterin synthase n=1 Tax=Ramlibacter alkalitolerans TaxID=2039631 RepID=A0ABS1JUP5_9BURK|nr:6-carboxytetrahydropterin synthase [Ramlibacter alkalitolerans]MBL0427968.1 6-carboxytetrahydropterin synthase [Ramlibacter alkalitolerans]
MSTSAHLTVSTASFEAARQVAILPHGHRSRRLHGHSFNATVFAELRRGWGGIPGSEVSALGARLRECIAPLDYSLLNDHLETPTDENLARWIYQRLGTPGIARVAIQSTAVHGVDLDRDRLAHVWRRYRFQSAHRLPYVPAGHKCGRMHGHGFEVIIHANQDLGTRPISIDYDHLDDLWAPLHFDLNYRCLNEIGGLENPTSEVIAAWIWRRLKPQLPELSWVTVYETASCGANFDGSEYRIWKEFSFDSATSLAHAPETDPRSQIHGHTYTLRLHMQAPLDREMGWTIDFGDVKQIFDPIFKALDHQPLRELQGIHDGDTGSLAAWIFAQAHPKLPVLSRIDLYETPGCGTLLAESLDGPCMPV